MGTKPELFLSLLYLEFQLESILVEHLVRVT